MLKNEGNRAEPAAPHGEFAMSRPCRDRCMSRCGEFRFGLYVFDADMPPGLDLWWDTGAAREPVSLAVDRAGDAEIRWRDDTPTHIGGMPTPVRKALWRHGHISVATGSAETPQGRVLLLPAVSTDPVRPWPFPPPAASAL